MKLNQLMFWALFFLSPIFLLPATAQAEVDTFENQLYVRPLKTPLARDRLISATVITAEDISRYCPGCDFADILERAGVNVRRFHGNFYQSSDTDTVYLGLRGVSDAQTSFYINDIRVRDAMLGEPEWSFVTTNNIERIEIVRGPLVTGNTNIGGEIRVWTKKAQCEVEKFCAHIKTEHSNKSATGRSAFVSFANRTENSGFIVSAQGDRSKDSHGIPNLDDSSHYKEQTLNLAFDHQTIDDKWSFEGHSVVYKSQNKGDITPSPKKGSSNVVSLGSTYHIDPDLLIKSLAGYNKEQQHYGAKEIKYTSRRISLKLWGEYRFDFADGNYILKTGVEKHREKIYAPPNTYDLDQRHTIAGFGSLYGERGPYAYQVTARADRLSGDIDRKVWTWNGAVSRHIARVQLHDIFIRSGVGTGFRAPGFDEQYFTSFDPDAGSEAEGEPEVVGTFYDNNPDLDVERAFHYELGLRLEKDTKPAPHYFLDITAFKTKLKNSVIFGDRQIQALRNGSIVYIVGKDQQESAWVQGLEFQTGFRLESCSGIGQYTLTDPDDTKRIRGHNPLRQMGALSLSCLMTPQWRVGTSLTYRGDRDQDPPHNDTASVWDVHLTWTPRPKNTDLKLQLAVRNIGDKEYDLYNYTEGQGRALWLIFSSSLF